MNRLLRFDWIGRHKIATVGVAAAALVLGLGLARGRAVFRGNSDAKARFDSAVAARRSAESLLESKQFAESDRHCRQAIEILTALAAGSSDSRIRFEQAAALETRALVQSAADQPDEADALYRKAIDVWARLLSEDQTSSELRFRLARCLSRRAPLLTARGLWEEAEKNLERASIVCRTQVGNTSSDPRILRALGAIRNQLGLIYLHKGRWELARATFDAAVKQQKKLLEDPSFTALDQEFLVTLLINQSRADAGSKLDAAAPGKIDQALKLAEGLGAGSRSSSRYRDLVATLLETEASKLEGVSGGAQQARSLFERAFAIREPLVQGTSVEPEYLERLAQACGALAATFDHLHLDEKAEEFERKEVSYYSRLATLHPEATAFRIGRGKALHNLADLLLRRGKGAEALVLEREATPLLMAVYHENVLDPDRRRAISYAYWTLCTLELDRKDYKRAADAIAEYQSIEPGGFEEAHEAAGFLCRCILLCRDDHALPAAKREKLAQSYTDRALGALQTAVREGFRDLHELTTLPIYEPLRIRREFSRIVSDVKALDEALREG